VDCDPRPGGTGCWFSVGWRRTGNGSLAGGSRAFVRREASVEMLGLEGRPDGVILEGEYELEEGDEDEEEEEDAEDEEDEDEEGEEEDEEEEDSDDDEESSSSLDLLRFLLIESVSRPSVVCVCDVDKLDIFSTRLG
jgi:hypothetical protein